MHRRLILLISLSLLLLNIVLAAKEPLLMINIKEDKVTMVNIIEKNDFYYLFHQDIFEAIEEQDAYYRLKLYANNKLLIDAAPFPESFIYQFDVTATRIEVIHEKNNKVIFEKEINVCNHNNICEPASQQNDGNQISSNYESSLVCSDCKQSADDNFCEIIHDDVCDPDCNNLEYECDEKSLASDGLLDNAEFQCKKQFNGDLCKEAEECLTTSIIINSRICCEGVCSEKFTLKEELQEGNSNQISEAEQIYVGKLKADNSTETTFIITIISVISLILLISVMTFFFMKQKYVNRKLFAEVNELISQYNYSQIRTILAKKGYSQAQIEKAIALHYNKYKSYYEKQFNKHG